MAKAYATHRFPSPALTITIINIHYAYSEGCPG